MTTGVVVLGLPSAGKSSFIAALSHVLQFKEVPTVLKFDRLSAEDKYLFELRAAWQNCKPFGRTTGGPVHSITLHLTNDQGDKLDVSFPDIVGEEFEEQWRGREWSPEFTAAAETATGLLLFINPLTVEKPFSKADVAAAEDAILAALGEDESDSCDDQEVDQPISDTSETSELTTGELIAREVANENLDVIAETSDPKIWNPRDADGQVKTVDVLQGIAAFGGDRQWTLGIVVSAWDVVKKQVGNLTPGQWLERALPMVAQYLDSNPHHFLVRTFGVSAQGGNPALEADRLRGFDAQSERVEVVCEGYQGHDLTRILLWALEQG